MRWWEHLIAHECSWGTVCYLPVFYYYYHIAIFHFKIELSIGKFDFETNKKITQNIECDTKRSGGCSCSRRRSTCWNNTFFNSIFHSLAGLMLLSLATCNCVNSNWKYIKLKKPKAWLVQGMMQVQQNTYRHKQWGASSTEEKINWFWRELFFSKCNLWTLISTTLWSKVNWQKS